MALFFAINSLGTLLGSGLLALSEAVKLIGTKKHYDLTYYFFLLAALMLVSWIIFIIYVERSKRKRLRQPRARMFNRTRSANPSDIT
jgi:membrane protein CcdC involved in cytochrome C biogenesis